MNIEGLRFGPLSRRVVHAAIDMQRLFAEETEWASPLVQVIAPTVARICARAPHRTLFTRFITPEARDEMPGQWRIYYSKWESLLALRPDLLDLLPGLREFTPPARVVDKYVHSAFEAPAFQNTLDELDTDTIVFTGVETDVCVLATAMTAMDRGYRTILISDAIASSSPKGHDAAMTSIYPRFDQQIEVIDSATLLEAWAP
jgi:nicotinamidase-related amidase